MIKNNIKVCWILLALTVNLSVSNGQENSSQIPNASGDSIINVAFGSIKKKDVIGAISSINVKELIEKSFGTYSLDNLQSFIGGYTGNIWGQSPLILVDGVERRASDVRLNEIETISIIKDASSLALYGSAGSRGVVLIKTKRGEIKPLGVDIRLNTGVFVPKIYPSYLNASEYMTLYNEALRNDGLTEKYSNEEIYNTSIGTNKYKYPDLNLYSDEYLRKLSYKTDLTTEISGGNDRTTYYTNIGMAYNNNIVKYGVANKNNDFSLNIRSNVDMKLTDWLRASTDAVAVMTDQYYARGDFWGMASSFRPNNDWFHPMVPIDMLDPDNEELQILVKNSNNIIDGKYLLGGLSTIQTNQLSQMIASGYIKNKHRTFMFNVGAEADLTAITPGLKLKSQFSMDYTSRYTEGYTVPYATYQPEWVTIDGKDIIKSLQKFGNDGNSTNEFIGTSLYDQTLTSITQLDYQRTFSDKHNVSGKLVGFGYISQFSSDPDTDGGSQYHPYRNTNLGIHAGYNYSHKYYFNFNGNIVHSSKLPEHNRKGFSPTGTIGWRVNEENFIKDNVSFINDLKLTGSYASLKQDLDINGHYLYSGNFGNQDGLGGWFTWRDGASGGYTTMSGRGANHDLSFVTRDEIRAGFESSLFNNSLIISANYFKQNIKGLLSRGSTLFPSYFTGQGDFLPNFNFGEEMRKGFDFSVNLNQKINDFSYNLGFVGMIYNSEVIRREENYEYAYQNRVSRPLDAYFGYITEGFFQSQDEIDNHARQTFGGTLKLGDIKYRDVNEDGLVDGRDQVDLGHNGWAANPFSYGINLTLKYKNLTFFAMGSGIHGAIGFKNNSYYWVRGLNKYSDVVLDRWTEQTATTATYPRLTSTSSANNFQNSTFWMYDNNRFNLTRVQFTYDLREQLFKNSSTIKKMGIYVNGDNLLVISKERKMMETNFGSAPQNRFYNLGLVASF
ncbi:SusC/RagA family TonB-linked outer membrane protein [Sphingobacterium bovistauri]|uniref:SusC/RagA family TonB-linked outer membrane protein n=1 Tax=Sphingobacterium bovistauri TaxID=2781959 RepID=A0ABS7Z376_9SPHI|nr:SusC/RagA family TonB-linked outer membrane protein [Sphingobacterium bovistauri]MCA5004621.1 SusC/RagA family TonB-linked outer membrane protein [Sphingobacterium bovistauri]